MKLHFEPDLDFQLQAIEAVCDLFRGQEVCRTEFTVTPASSGAQAQLAFAENDLGVGNRLTLLDEEILKNLKDIQLRNGVPPSVSAGLRRLHGGDGNGHGQDVCLPAHDLRAEQTVRIHQVRHRRALRRHQGRRLQVAPDHRGPFSGRSTRERPSTIFSTIPTSSVRCGISPPARRSRSWW